MDHFGAARLKIGRAQKHLSDFEAEILALRETYSSSVEKHGENQWNSLKAEFSEASKAILAQLALTSGDAVHNLRIALDYAWIGALKRNRGAITNWTKLPVARTLGEVEALATGAKTNSSSPVLFDYLISQLRPFEAGTYHIWGLHSLDIQDKHRLLLPVVQYMSIEGIRVRHLHTGDVVTGGTYGFPYSAPVYVDFGTSQIEDHGKPNMSVVFAEGMPFELGSVADTLKEISKVVEYYVAGLEEVVPT